MTTAHKPTYHPAVGQSTTGGYRYHAPRQQLAARDLAAHMALKYRAPAQLATQYEHDLHEKEQAHFTEHQHALQRQGKIDAIPQQDQQHDASPPRSSSPPLPSSAPDLSAFDDADDVVVRGHSDDDAHDDDDDDDDSDDSDDEAELARELDLIRREREAQRLKQAEAEAQEAERRAQQSMAHNPLLTHLAPAQDDEQVSGVKRRWDDDVVFKNQARGDVSNKPKKRFINDTIRSDFHRNFLNKYVH